MTVRGPVFYCKLLAAFVFVFSFVSYSFGMEGNVEEDWVSSFPIIAPLKPDFECEDKLLQKHIFSTLLSPDTQGGQGNSVTVNWLNSVEPTQITGATNFLRVGLYAFDHTRNGWDFFYNDIMYPSGWEEKGANQKEDLRNISLGTIYNGGAKYQKDNYKKTTLLEDFKNRGCPLDEDKNFPFLSRAHSEQAFVSHLQQLQREEKKNGIQNTSNYTSLVLLFVSTNEPCPSCGPTLLNCLGAGGFREFVLEYFPVAHAQQLDPSITVSKNENSMNIFYSYHNKTNDLKTLFYPFKGSHLYTHPGILSQFPMIDDRQSLPPRFQI